MTGNGNGNITELHGNITWADADTFVATRPDLWAPMAAVKWVSAADAGRAPTLHQLWASLTTGRQEWRVVPTETMGHDHV